MTTKLNDNPWGRYRVEMYPDGGPEGQALISISFHVGMRDAASVGRSVHFASFGQWLGQAREAALLPIREQLTQALVSGSHALLTNGTSVEVLEEVPPYAKVAVRCWMEGSSDSPGPTLTLKGECRLERESGTVIAARLTHQVTWVRFDTGGVPRVEPLPAWLGGYLSTLLTRPPASTTVPPASHLGSLERGRHLFDTGGGPGPGPVLRRDEFHPTMSESNIVGNVYFSTFFHWQGAQRDRFLHRLLPGYFASRGTEGELLPIASRVKNLRDVFPLDEVEAVMSLRALDTRAVRLGFEFFRLGGSHAEKLAVAELDSVWVVRGKDGRLESSALPERLVEALRSASQS